jgi:alpha-tubulin suppressor-like RCC1 family protein
MRHRLFLPIALLAIVDVGCGGGDGTGPQPTVEAASLTINQSSFLLERGFHQTLTATAKDKDGATISIPVVWRSSDERVATLDANGRVTALDTGITTITASTLGAAASPIGIRVIWQGAAKIESYQYAAPSAATRSTRVPDSLRVRVTGLDGNPTPNARVAFTSTAGGGIVSPAVATTNQNGVAAAQWTLGSADGLNTVTASVLADDDKALSFVAANPVSFSITTFNVFDSVVGDAQSGSILSPLGTNPSVRVLDAAGKPQPGVRVTFTASAEGRVATAAISTGADGVASPGAWTLGDSPGDQTLTIQVESAALTLHATATGAPLFMSSTQVASSDSASCAIRPNGTAECWGVEPKVGDGATAPQRSVPIPTSGGILFASLVGGQSHFCGVGTDQSLYCWGDGSYTSASATGPRVPTKIASASTWSQVAPGYAHTCALDTSKTAYCWGANGTGQLGDGTTTGHIAPGAVSGNFQFNSLVSGAFHSCGLDANGAAFCWGLNQNGQVGDGTTTMATTPTKVKNAATGEALVFQALGAGESWTCGLTTAGRVYCWGRISSTTTTQTTPVQYVDAPAFTTLSVGRVHACALTSDGSAWCWGSNSAGQLGDSTTVDRAKPTAVAGPLKFKSIAAGYRHTCARTLLSDNNPDTDGAIACWGTNDVGELGVTTVSSRLVPRRLVLGIK